jgi:hypothetical protein
MDKVQQLEAARELAEGFDRETGRTEFYAVAVASKDLQLLSAGDLVDIFSEVHGLSVPQPEPTQSPSTATSASDVHGQEGGVPLSLKDA